MAGSPNELQYGQRSQLQQLGQKELGVTGGMRPGRPAGRPSAVAPAAARPVPGAAPVAPAQTNAVPDEHRQLMVDYLTAERAVRTAQWYAMQPGAGPWSQLMLQAATMQRDHAGLTFQQGTPSWSF